MVVVDVVSKNHCICKTENGRLLENISISKLETVIPRSDPAYVMVVKGKRKGQVLCDGNVNISISEDC